MTRNKPHDHYTTPQSLSLELRHVGMISDLVQATGMTRSAIARLAIEEYYARHHPEVTQENATNDRQKAS